MLARAADVVQMCCRCGGSKESQQTASALNIANIRSSVYLTPGPSFCSPDDRYISTYSMVVICDLLTFRDQFGSKDANTLPALYCPVFCLAVWLTGMIDESCFVAFHGCIYESSTPVWVEGLCLCTHEQHREMLGMHQVWLHMTE